MLVSLILFVAVLISTLSGFGSSLIAMPLLTLIIGVQEAGPLVILIVILQSIAMTLRYKSAFHWKDIYLLCAGAIIGIPFGIIALSRLDEELILTTLGIVLVLYSLYSLFNKSIRVIGRRWAILFGFFGGGLAGAYNTYGPPIIIYGNSRNWSPEALKSNVQFFGLMNSLLVILLHLYNRNYTSEVMSMFWYALPGVFIAAVLGFTFDKHINKDLFRKIILILLLLVGLKMIFL